MAFFNHSVFQKNRAVKRIAKLNFRGGLRGAGEAKF
jgi:hypothetical protein